MEDYRLLIIYLKDCFEEIILNLQDFLQYPQELIDRGSCHQLLKKVKSIQNPHLDRAIDREHFRRNCKMIKKIEVHQFRLECTRYHLHEMERRFLSMTSNDSMFETSKIIEETINLTTFRQIILIFKNQPQEQTLANKD